MKKNLPIFKLLFALLFLVWTLFFFGPTTTFAAQNLAVTPPGWDDIGAILKKQGLEFAEIQESDLKLGENLKGYDAIFINCSRTIYKEEVTPEDAGAIRDFVRSGGVVYASDYAGSALEAAFPDKIDFYDFGQDQSEADYYNEVIYSGIGYAGDYNATIVDSGLAAVLGKKSIEINFDKDGWEVIKSVGEGVRVHMRGPASFFDEEQEKDTSVADLPYVVSFSEGEGEVIFTSFHNEKQITQDVEKMLEWFVTRTRSSKLAKATREIAKKDNDDKILQEIVDTIGQDQEKIYEFKASGGSFGLIVNFEKGAQLLTQIIAPDGTTVVSDKVDDPPYIKKNIRGKSGTYKFKVLGQKVSENNLPVVLMVFGPEKAAVEPILDDGSVVEGTSSSLPSIKKTAGIVISILIILAIGYFLKRSGKVKLQGKKTKK